VTNPDIRGINHVSFTVYDLRAIVRFFTEFLGFEVMNESPRDSAAISRVTGVAGAEITVAFIRGHGYVIEFIRYDSHRHLPVAILTPCEVGFSHVGFNVTNIEALIARAKAYGFAAINPPTRISQGPNTGMKVCYLRNGEGFTIEFLQAPAVSG
jgi:catechol 2,3-dioxygenase-like lactoylglutathione lyase family enzyme